MNYKQCIVILIMAQFLYFTPVFLKGEVIFAHSNTYEVGDSNYFIDERYLSNRKFSDQSSVYIPEINQHLKGNHHSWLSTWNPYVQLGRPTFQLSGFSRAYLITNVLSLFTKNPFVLYTVLTVITVFFTGIFLFLFLKAIDLHPIACSIAAIGLSLGVYVSYWLTFLLFISTICWSVALLWLNTEFIKKPSFTRATGISFATYSLLMTGYPQFIVLSAYLIVPYTLIALRKSDSPGKNQVYTALMLLGIAISGVLMASPAYIDLFINSQRSARLAGVTDDFFLAVLPPIKNIKDLETFIASIFDPFWFGNPISPKYPVSFNGFSLNPFYFTLFLFSFLNRQGYKLCLWQIFSFLCLIGTIWTPAYLFSVHHLGFHLSRLQLLSGAIIPSFILVGYAVDSLIINKEAKPINLMNCAFITVTLFSIFQFWMGFKSTLSLKLNYIIICFLIIAALFLLIFFKRYVLFQGLALISVLIYGQSMMLVRPIDTIQTSSPLISLIKEQTSDGFRFAIVGDEMAGIIPPNQEALLQIKSINSYDSLSSKNYQQVVKKWSKNGTHTYGRYFDKLDSELNTSNNEFILSGVNLIISKTNLDDPRLVKLDKVDNYKIYKPLIKPLILSQFVSNYIENNNSVSLKLCCLEASKKDSQIFKKYDDFLKTKVVPINQETLLFVSQQYHPQWKAFSNTVPLKTVIVNEFYQGVIIPPDTTEVNLKFKPYVLWSWLPQLIYGSLGGGFLITQLVKLTRQSEKSRNLI